MVWLICGVACLFSKTDSRRGRSVVFGVFFVLFGIAGPLGCYLIEPKLYLAALFLPMAALFLWYFFVRLSASSRCSAEIDAVFVKYNEYRGVRGVRSYAPVFRYNYNGADYERQTAESFSALKLPAELVPSGQCRLYINPDRPEDCAFRTRLSMSDYLMGLAGADFAAAYFLTAF